MRRARQRSLALLPLNPRPLAVALSLFATGAAGGSPAPQVKDAAGQDARQTTLCAALEAASAKHDLPRAFFTRLIWQESRFDPAARSPAGAEGVAQFMPLTASDRGLADPFEPTRALDESAAYLSDLRAKFGNLGLAAAAYNAGPGRVARWLAGSAALPSETVSYVLSVTGRSANEWRAPSAAPLAPEPGFSCLAFAGNAGRLATPNATTASGSPANKPWAVILAGSFNRQAVLAEYTIVRGTFSQALAGVTPVLVQRHLGGEARRKYVVQIETDDRGTGNRLCKKLESAGGNCVVLRNLLR